ncbi:MAG: hypothetical protein GTN93_23905 [Anaerolineae bacterium]|nr:hypothetical protein [Anaerolineae bacterium]
MAQIYPRERLDQLFSRSAAAARGQSEEVMDGKGLPPVASSAGVNSSFPSVTEQALRVPH